MLENSACNRDSSKEVFFSREGWAAIREEFSSLPPSEIERYESLADMSVIASKENRKRLRSMPLFRILGYGLALLELLLAGLLV